MITLLVLQYVVSVVWVVCVHAGVHVYMCVKKCN